MMSIMFIRPDRLLKEGWEHRSIAEKTAFRRSGGLALLRAREVFLFTQPRVRGTISHRINHRIRFCWNIFLLERIEVIRSYRLGQPLH